MFGERIQQLRLMHEETQKDLANFLGVSRQTVANYETGKHEPDFETLKKIADHYKVSIDYLLGRTNNKLHIINMNNCKDYPEPILNLIDALHSLYLEKSNANKIEIIKFCFQEISKLL